MLRPGDLVRYGYLWAREAEHGAETARKVRPACVVVRTPATPSALFLFPLTSQQPDKSRPHLAVSEIECRRGGLDFPSFLILDEYNRFLETEAFDLVTPKPIGSFSTAFLRKIAARVKELGERRQLQGVVRR